MEIWEQVKAFLQHQFLTVELWRIVAAVAAVAVAWLIKKLVVGALVKGLLALTRKTETELDDLLVEAFQPPLGAMTVVVGFYAAALLIRFPKEPVDVHGFVMGLLRTTAILIVAWALYRCVKVLTRMLTRLTKKTKSDLDDHLVPFVEKFFKVVVIIIAFVMVVREWGYDISGLLAGLGLGGLAFALAAKDTLANLFGSLMIITDRPFGIGDWIKTSAVEGTVEEIGFRSTKVRTFANSLVTVPNSVIALGTVENWSRMVKRRIYFKLGVTYGTTLAQMRETVNRIKDVVAAHPEIRQDFWLVNFTDFNDSSLDIMIYCFTKTTVWAEFLDVRQDLNMKIMKAIEEIGVSAAFPSRSIYMENPDPREVEKYDRMARAMLAERARAGDSSESLVTDRLGPAESG